MERHERLRQARHDAGFYSAADAARRLAMPYGTYSGHENGLRGITDLDLQKYAKAFKVSLGWLAFGRDDQTGKSTIRVAGILSRQSTIQTDPKNAGPFWENDPDFGTVDLPFIVPDGLIAYIVDGWDMRPAFRANDTILVWEHQKREPLEFINEIAVVRLKQGSTYICDVGKGDEPGKFCVYSFNLNLMKNVEVEWIGEIFSIIPAMQIVTRTDEIHRERVAAAGRRALKAKAG